MVDRSPRLRHLGFEPAFVFPAQAGGEEPATGLHHSHEGGEEGLQDRSLHIGQDSIHGGKAPEVGRSGSDLPQIHQRLHPISAKGLTGMVH